MIHSTQDNQHENTQAKLQEETDQHKTATTPSPDYAHAQDQSHAQDPNPSTNKAEAHMRATEPRSAEELEQERAELARSEARPKEDWDELAADEGTERDYDDNDNDDDSDLIELVRYRLKHPAGTVKVTLDELLTL